MNEIIDPELIKAFAELTINNEPVSVEYRAYYDDNGLIIFVSPEPHDAPLKNNSIVVSKDVYENSHKFIVVNNDVLPKFSNDLGVRPSLIKSNKKGFTVVKNNPALLIESDEIYQEIEYYDYRNN